MPRTRKCRRLAGWCACVLLLAACATAEPPRLLPSDAVFSAEGRMSVVSTEGDQLPHSTTGRFSWIERPGGSEIALYSPFGETLARIDVGRERSVLRTPQAIESAPTPEALLQRYLGLTLPVSGLRDWMRGRSRSGARRAPDGFEEDGWRISYPQMQDDGALPRIVRLERALPSAVEVRIVVDRWDGRTDS